MLPIIYILGLCTFLILSVQASTADTTNRVLQFLEVAAYYNAETVNLQCVDANIEDGVTIAWQTPFGDFELYTSSSNSNNQEVYHTGNVHLEFKDGGRMLQILRPDEDYAGFYRCEVQSLHFKRIFQLDLIDFYCNMLPEIENGNIVYTSSESSSYGSNTYINGTVATYNCARNSQLQGPATKMCLMSVDGWTFAEEDSKCL